MTRLGNDTIAVERLWTDGRELRAEVLLRTPRTTLRSYRVLLGDDGRPVSMETITHDPAGGTSSDPLSREAIRFTADSVYVEPAAESSVHPYVVAGGRDVLPFIDMVHWPFDPMMQRAHAAAADSIVVPLLTGRRTMPFIVKRIGDTEYTVTHPFRGTMTVEVDAEGRVLQLDASQTTRKLEVTRVGDLDLSAIAREFAARDAGGRAFGELSGRGEASATIGGATIAVDYGRPAKRGREIFGHLVPWNEVWRTGANRATHLTSDRDFRLGGARIPAGTYTLFTVPRPDGWRLIVNRRTDINGTAYDAEHDLVHIEMETRERQEVVEEFTIRVDQDGEGGVLRFQWDRTEAFAPIEVLES